MGKSQIVLTIILFNLFFILFLVGIFVFIKQYRIKKKEHNASLLLQKEEYKKQLLENQLEIQNQTMQYIGQEIHDNVGQKLTLASLYTQQLAFENKAPNITESIENISNIINESLSDLRELSKSLTDDFIVQNSLEDLILQEKMKVEKTKKCNIFYKKEKINKELNYQEKSILLRITQEFIQNSLKYSKCKNIHIDLSILNSSIILNLKDDGVGFDVSKQSKGIGLKNMYNRTAMLNGDFKLISNPNSGTKLNITIPLS